MKQNVLEVDGEIEDIIRALTTLNTDKRMLVQNKISHSGIQLLLKWIPQKERKTKTK